MLPAVTAEQHSCTAAAPAASVPAPAPGDMGRSIAALSYSDILNCMHCGLCLATCPTYDLLGLERASPRGRIALMRAVAQEDLPLTAELAAQWDLCLGCLACETACPAGVSYHSLLEEARDLAAHTLPARGIARWTRPILLRWLFLGRRRIQLLGWLLFLARRSGLQALGVRSGILRRIAPRIAAIEPLAPVVRPPFTSRRLGRWVMPAGPPRYRVGMLIGCVQDIVFADVNEITARVLAAVGCAVYLPPEQPCCGSLMGHNGEMAAAREAARRTVRAFRGEPLDALVINAAGCGSFVRHYDKLLADDPELAAPAADLARRTVDFGEWLDRIGLEPRPARPVPLRVTYDAPCHLIHGQKISGPVERVLAQLPGLALVPLVEHDWCCGSAGIYNITHPDESRRILERKIGHIRDSGAGVVVTGNPGCMLQLRNGLRDAGLAGRVRVEHPATVVGWAYFGMLDAGGT